MRSLRTKSTVRPKLRSFWLRTPFRPSTATSTKSFTPPDIWPMTAFCLNGNPNPFSLLIFSRPEKTEKTKFFNWFFFKIVECLPVRKALVCFKQECLRNNCTWLVEFVFFFKASDTLIAACGFLNYCLVRWAINYIWMSWFSNLGQVL